MKNLFLSLFAVCLVVLLSDCTKEETVDSSSGIKIKCYLDHVPLLNDTAYASFSLNLFHIPDHKVDSIISMKLAIGIAEIDSKKNRISEKIDTIQVVELNSEIITDLDIYAPDTGNYLVTIHTEAVIEWMDSLGNKYLNFTGLIIAEDRDFLFRVRNDGSELLDSSNVTIGAAETSIKNITNELTLINTVLLMPNPQNINVPMSLICTVDVADSVEILYIAFIDNSSTGNFTADSLLMFQDLNDTTIICSTNYITNDTGVHIISLKANSANTLAYHLSSIFLMQTDEEGIIIEIDSVSVDAPEIPIIEQQDTLVFTIDTLVSPGLLPDDTTTYDDDSLWQKNNVLMKLMPTYYAWVEGTILLIDQNEDSIPLRRATVVAYDRDDGDLFDLNKDDKLGSALTDMDGKFSIGPFKNSDCEGTQDVYLKIFLAIQNPTPIFHLAL